MGDRRGVSGKYHVFVLLNYYSNKRFEIFLMREGSLLTIMALYCHIKATERYLHVKKEQLVNIISPIDDLLEKGKIEI